ncbi:exonuclease [Microdochium bolleyi]|uniref:Exonuclease n=1 Tax=Microdochium bolleyi TaxID=196109 RepID=A0A136IQB8_9PEZI|nr:exonuclease [Microdochium bolleyi]
MWEVSRRTSPCISVDLEGVRMSRHGTVSLVTIFDHVLKQTYLVDIHTLQGSAFTTSLPLPDTSSAVSTSPATPWTLKAILESPTITKLFFDVRHDSDALYSHFGIRLAGVEDVQLMECADRPAGRRRFVMGLQKCIDNFAQLTPTQRAQSKAIKEYGVRTFDPQHGGSYEVFNRRPLDREMALYCINDVKYLSVLRDILWRKLTPAWRAKVASATSARIALSQSADYQPYSKDNASSPWPFE